MTGTAAEASHPAAQVAGIHRKSASAAVASGGGAGPAARRSRRSVGGSPEGPRLHSIDSGASDELSGTVPTLGHPLPSASDEAVVSGDFSNDAAADFAKPGDLQQPAPPAREQ